MKEEIDQMLQIKSFLRQIIRLEGNFKILIKNALKAWLNGTRVYTFMWGSTVM